MKEAKKRIEYIDLAKGICILLVVWLHITDSVKFAGLGETDIVTKYCLAFLMPLYFFLSGMFFKTDGHGWNFILKKINNLLVPFLAFNLISCILGYILISLGLGNFGRVASYCGWQSFFYFVNGEVYLNQPIWFLLCLFEVNVIYYCVHLLTKGNVLVKMLIVSVVGIAGYILMFDLGVWLPCFMSKAMYFLPFFVMGKVVRKYSTLLIDSKGLKYDIGAFFIALFVFVLLSPVSNILFAKFNMLNFYVCGFTGTIMVLLLSKIVKKVPAVSYIGRYSIVTLCLHYYYYPIILKFLMLYFTNSYVLNIGTFLITTLIGLVFIPLCIRYLPYIFAQKDLIKIKE